MLLEINGVDCSGYLTDYKYDTSLERIDTLRYTDTDGIEHVSPLRWKAHLNNVPLKVLTNEQAMTLANILSASSLSVRYLHGALGIVTQDMILDDPISRGRLPSNDNRYWWNGGKLNFTQR